MHRCPPTSRCAGNGPIHKPGTSSFLNSSPECGAARHGPCDGKTGTPSDFRPNHGLRHAFASALASSGETDLYTIQKLLGHRTPLMTARYSHLHDEALRRGVDVMGRMAEKKEGTAGGGVA